MRLRAPAGYCSAAATHFQKRSRHLIFFELVPMLCVGVHTETA
ncbi:hypothetical protein Dalk_1617 [Desulfatibacillum aliphaticivorans]|uniref:Uncharacterized protein n=1 Tax=Desulfatibacillum aliphaticivorans TaxID=218208 RepID=B8FAL9_DESAL|nr:hypothetical protein Dalk_1617 [Desulfatibacillum aliphaticivorans]